MLIDIGREMSFLIELRSSSSSPEYDQLLLDEYPVHQDQCEGDDQEYVGEVEDKLIKSSK